MRAEPTIRLFQTLPHACGYYADRTAQNLVIDPAAPQLDKLYGPALEQGFRRAGGHLYFPQCPQCQACTPCRVDVEKFQPDRSQRRCLKRNADLEVIESMPSYNREAWPQVWISRADDYTRARELMRSIGIEPVIRHADELAAVRNPTPTTQRRGTVVRVRRIVMIAVLAACAMVVLRYMHIV